MELKLENFQYFFTHNALLLREMNKYTQYQLADAIGITRKTIGAIEEGRAVGLENLHKYSHFFNVPINLLIERKLKRNEIILKENRLTQLA